MTVKTWYVLGLTIPAAIFFAGILERIYSRNIFGKLLVFIFIFFTFSNTLKAHLEYLGKNFNKPSDNPSNLMNEIKAVDWVYQQAEGKGFRVYRLRFPTCLLVERYQDIRLPAGRHCLSSQSAGVHHKRGTGLDQEEGNPRWHPGFPHYPRR